MILIQNKHGNILKSFSFDEGSVYFHRQLGFVSQDSLIARTNLRSRVGYKERDILSQILFSFDIKKGGKDQFDFINTKDCKIQKENHSWKLETAVAPFMISTGNTVVATAGLGLEQEEEKSHLSKIIFALMLLGFLFMWFVYFGAAPVKTETAVVPPEVILKVKEIQKQVVPVPVPQAPKVVADNHQAVDKNVQVKKALTQTLGFLKLLGKKDLKGANGGLPTPNIKEATAGAGPGGKEGSGGEMLQGLGQGLRKTTVGNTGYAGLGGVGTKGAGGGLGGYGETSYASGAGSRVSAQPLANDASVEGGLDRSLILATIKRYESQVRACYEEGLKRKPEMIGQVTMDFEINGTGALNYANVKKSSLGDKEVESCISMRMKTWKFPTPKGGVNVPVTYPFMLRPVKS